MKSSFQPPEHKYTFSELVDLEAFGEVLKSFAKATGTANGLVTEEGESITQGGWVSACETFHRANPKSSKRCIESNIALMSNLRDGEVASDHCKNGLIDYATPVVIEGRRLATLFLGQVFESEPDFDFFKKQAKKYHYDEKSYLEAIRKVPIVSRAQMQSLMECMVAMAQMLAASGLAQLRQKTLEANLERNTEQRIELQDILRLSPVGIGWSDEHGNIEYVNQQFTDLFGYTLKDIPDLDHWYAFAYPDEVYRKDVVDPWYQKVAQAHENHTQPPDFEANITCKDSSVRRVQLHVSWVGLKRLVTFSDMSAHWKSEQRNLAHDKMLEMVAKGEPLSDILNEVVCVVESEDKGSLCSIILLDDERKRFVMEIAPNLPKFYNEAIHGVEIGMGVGSCGTAAYLRKRIIVEDTYTHEYWKDYKNLVQSAGLHSCWSEPIISSDGDIMGTFAIYHTVPSLPDKTDIERISFAANLAAVAIENKKVREELERRAYHDYLTGLANRRHFFERAEEEIARRSRHGGALSVLMFDIDHFKQINDFYGHSTGDLVLKKVAQITLETLREIDLVGRIGGEEFAVLLSQTGLDEAVRVAERLRISIEKSEIVLNEGLPPHFSVSFGVTEAGARNINIDTLLNRADKALYEAKESGRNRVCVATEDIA